MIEHPLEVARTARYFSLGDPHRAEHVWIALHGYGQLAATFLGYLAPLNTGSRLIIAPEALSRFYHDQGRGPIGASWMTREDRDHEIVDYVRYLDRVDAEVRERIAPGARVYLLGFSQGVATAGRWLDRGHARHDGYCFWAGTLPPELALDVPHPVLAGRRVAISAGHRDDFLPQDWLTAEVRRLTTAGAEARAFPFHGGHRLDRTVLAEVAAFLEAP